MQSSTLNQRLKSGSCLSLPGFWLFVLAFGVRLVVLSRLSTTPYFAPESGDMKFYNDWALRIAHGALTDYKAFYGLPGYAYLLAAIYTIVGSDPFAVGVLQAVSEALIAVVIYRIAQAVFAGDGRLAQWTGILASLGWIFFQPAQTFSAILMPTTWLVLAYWSCILWILNIKECSFWRPWLWMGLGIGVVAMMIATVLFLVPLILAAVILKLARGEPLFQRFVKIGGATCCILLGIYAGSSPCWLHNYLIAKEPVMLSAHSGINFYIGNNPVANGYPKIPPGMRAGQEGMLKDSITMAEVAAGHPLKRAEVSRYWSGRANEYIHTQFRAWLGLLGTKFRNFWNAYQYDDLSLVTLFSESGVITPGLRFGLIAALAMPGMIFAGYWVRRSRWVIAAILLHMSALMPVFVTERYRLAAVPGLLLMAAYGLWKLWDDLCLSKWPRAALYLGVLAVSIAFVSMPQSDPGLWSLDYYNTGIKATEAGNLDNAQRNLELAYAYVPDNSEINFALGNLWLKKADRTRAKQFYRRAIELNSRHASALNNLGVLAIEEERWKLAADFLSASVNIEPEDAKAHYLLARARLKMGDIGGARSEIDEALRLKPQQAEFQALSEEIATPR